MRYFLKSAIFTIALSLGLNAFAQTTQKWREMHKVKKKETVYGIAKTYGITEEELRNANPEMKNEGYQLKKGDYIFIPYSKRETNEPSSTLPTQKVDVRQREIRVGIMLPLHNENGDGRRMVEYYRGILLAIEDLKSEGISVDLHAWNVPETADIGMTLLEKGASDCDIIFGPLYTKQMDRLSQFAKAYGIKLVVPFSINGDHVTDNANIFQVYQRPADRRDAYRMDLRGLLETLTSHRTGHHAGQQYRTNADGRQLGTQSCPAIGTGCVVLVL